MHHNSAQTQTRVRTRVVAERQMLRRLWQGSAAVRHRGLVRARTFATASSTSAAAFLASFLKPVGMGYAITVAIALAAQRKLQYFPLAEHPAHPQRVHPLFASIEEHEVTSADGTRILLWHWPAPRAGDAVVAPWYLDGSGGESKLGPVMRALRAQDARRARFDVLQFHGNAGSREGRLAWMHLVREGLGCSVTVVDYRGYGGSEGSPTERGLIDDGDAALSWLRGRQRTAAGRRLILWGESIGTGVAMGLVERQYLSPRRPPPRPVEVGEQDGAGPSSAESTASSRPKGEASTPPLYVILEAGFSSCVDVAAQAYPWLPVRLGMLDRYESAARARRVATSLGQPSARPPPRRDDRRERQHQQLAFLSIHGEDDEIAPIELGRALFDALPPARKRWLALQGTGHNDVPFHDPARYLREVAAFLDQEVEGGAE